MRFFEQDRNADNRGVLKRLRIVFIVCCCISAFSACMTSQPQSEDSYQQALAKKQLDELQEKMDQLYHRVSVIQFMVDNHERALRDMESQLAGNASPPPIAQAEPLRRYPDTAAPPYAPFGPNTAEALPAGGSITLKASPPGPPAVPPTVLYNKALAAYKSSDFAAAAADFDAFLSQYPDHELADNALYWKGECLYAQKNFETAITAFRQVIDRYPNGSKVPDAMLKAGYAYLSLNDKDNAGQFLKRVVKDYPFSPAGGKAEKMLKQIR